MSGQAPERWVRAATDSDRADALAFIARAARMSEAAVIRLHARPDGRLGLWTHTGFDVLATRSIVGASAPDDIVCDAEQLRGVLAGAAAGTRVDPGFTFGSAWKGALPPAGGYTHVDDVPARSVVELARSGAKLARTEGSAHGPATGLLDQGVLEVAPADGQQPVTIILRSVFALTAMGFIRDADGREVTDTSDLTRIAADEPVRVRASAAWIRIDARFGSVYQRRSRDLTVTPL
ncbi:hypothetical protein GII30_09265 [Gordonia amarae]|uniref:Uncharacterized protein n=2 Tax=Gordonia amarae TaxID=36821 RepID=G7GMW8_9ACTN|nr:hypothetical protein [Gordonia amarae]MCS3878569.1 hypothetical protein [Gordonia amarae]QHN17171.1 hypothetical protein GII35_09490 [Gordonia amarae]QHN21697.1 hypothetical protein GII34_09270 [Gordonia amarae]QHN30549.1 hypothetical protein GII32_09280 [Gordonia amarae]QHN39325.1 hypothetical protein GII30_09265 [Gordonia amarae]